MIEEATPLTTQQWSDKSGVNERYVREMMGSLVSGKIVEMTEDQLFYLPSGRAGPLKVHFLLLKIFDSRSLRVNCVWEGRRENRGSDLLSASRNILCENPSANLYCS